MNNLLIFFALPIAVIIISIALQKILRSPLLVASVIFAIFLVVTFIIDDLNFLVATIVYTIISFITAVIVKFIKENMHNNSTNSNFACAGSDNLQSNTDLLTVSSLNNNLNGRLNNTNYAYNQNDISNNIDGVGTRISVIPNSNVTSECFYGNHKKR